MGFSAERKIMDKPITFISIIVDYIRELFSWSNPDEWDDEDREKHGWWGK